MDEKEHIIQNKLLLCNWSSKSLILQLKFFTIMKYSIIKNKYKKGFILLFISLVLGNLLSCSDNDDIIAKVGTHKITLPEFQKRYDEFLFSTGIKDNLEMRKDILDNMINEILLYYYDDNNSIFSDPAYQKEIKWLEKEAVLAFVKDRDIYAKITATDDEIRSAYYKAHVSLAARHLFARTKEEADNLYELLKAGADFNTLAKQVFTDSTLKNNGGYLGYFTWGDMDPAFEEAAYNLKPGEISKPVQTAQGYSIIKLEERKVIPLMTEYDYQTRKKELARSLRISKKRSAEKEFVAKLFNSDKLTFDEEALNTFSLLLTSDKDYNENYNPNLTLCSYDGREYSIADILRRIKEIPEYHLQKLTETRFIKKAVEGILAQEKILEYAESKDYINRPEVKDAIYKLKMNKFLTEKMKQIALNAQIPDSAVVEYYEKNIALFSEPKRINVQEIIVNGKTEAENIITQIKGGRDFGELAKKHSLRKWSAENNGFLGLSPIDQFGYIKDKLWNAEIGEIVGPLEIKGVYGIFKVAEKIDARPIPYDKIKDQVREKVKLEQKSKLVMEYLKKKRKDVDVFIDKDKLGHIKMSI